MEEMEFETGVELSQLLLGRLKDSQLKDVYFDDDEDGRFLGLMFYKDDTEYHLTFEEDGTVQLAEGPVDGDVLDEVVTFGLDEVEAPFSADGPDDE